MNLLKLPLALLTICLVTLLTSCNRDKDETILMDDSIEMREQSYDENDISSSSNDIDDDINDAFNQTTLKASTCGNYSVTADTTIKTLQIEFEGTNCKGNRSRFGTATAVLTNGNKWSDANATIEVTYDSLAITNLATSRTIIINGTRTHTNLTGGKVYSMSNGDSIVHTIISTNMSIKFEDGSTRTWNVNKKHTWTKSNNIRYIKEEGMGEAGGYTNLINWGTNKRGNPFYTKIETPLQSNGLCGIFQPTSGVKKHILPTSGRTLTVTFGLDNQGNQTTSGCADGYKIEWTNSEGASKSLILKY